MASANLTAQRRTGAGKSAVRKLRAAGRTPAVLYGHGEKTSPLTVDTHELGVLFSHISVENTIINLKIEGERADLRALVREVQIHPASRRILHVDFYQVHAGERVEVEVPLRFTGSPAGVRAGGILHQNINSLPIRCLPDQIPEALEMDITELEIGQSLHAGQVPLPEGVTMDLDPESVICSVTPPTVAPVEAEVEVPEVAAEVAEPEVIRRRPEEGAEEEG